MTRLKQILIVFLGLVLAGIMVLLGLWQLNVYHAQGNNSAAKKAVEPPVDLRTVAVPGGSIQDGFGRSVRFEGTYDPKFQLLVPVASKPGAFRVLSALRQIDGSVVPVVRGVITGSTAPRPPAEAVTQVGVLLPSEDNAAVEKVDDGQLSSVRLPALAQQWPGPLISGFVSLSAADAKAQGLESAPLTLPQAGGRLRNGAYALQWWVFAAFALGMAIRIARDFGLNEDLAADDEIEPDPDRNPT